MRDSGEIEQIGRGLYRLADAPTISNPDLVIVALRSPSAIVCLISALTFHRLTTQIPRQVEIALPPGARSPKIDHPPIQVYRFSGNSLTKGVEIRMINGTPVRVFSAAKTVADCFKFRNKIGFDVAREALRDCWRQRRASMDELHRYAEIDRVANVMRPYMESLV